MDKQKQFLGELARLFDAYGVSVSGNEQYDGEENYCGTDWSLG